jgi:hypothetical protein
MTVDTVLPILIWMAIYNFFVCGFAGAYVSTEKNRAGHEGFLLGLFLGPVGVVVAACLPTLEAAVVEPPAAVEPVRIIPMGSPPVYAVRNGEPTVNVVDAVRSMPPAPRAIRTGVRP